MTNFHGLPVAEIIGFAAKPKFPSIGLALGDQAQDYVWHALANYVAVHPLATTSSGDPRVHAPVAAPEPRLPSCSSSALLKSNPHTSNLPASSLPMRDHVEDTLLNLFVVSVAILLLTLLFLFLNAVGVPILISRHMTAAADVLAAFFACRAHLILIAREIRFWAWERHAETRQRDHVHQLALQKQQRELEAQLGKVKMEEKAEEGRERAEERRLQREWDRWKLEKEWEERKQERELELKRLEVELARLQRQRAPSSMPSRPSTPAEGIEWGVPVEVEPAPLEEGTSASRKDVGGRKGKQAAKMPDWKY
ncbi:hypothetical protein BDZ91DRAFT_767403 [Kalaharituber pfeilii]|nr:hypothetical protein BDZ91DRAFT_767403 [Kalaharituber pfeilii]